ncbi:MAG: L-histidine N(alpha)-methyltransferase, partial [Pseudomonas sp.]
MAAAIHFHEQCQNGANASLREETLAGFADDPKWASPKFFYDRRGSELFEQICQQPEYY